MQFSHLGALVLRICATLLKRVYRLLVLIPALTTISLAANAAGCLQTVCIVAKSTAAAHLSDSLFEVLPQC